MGVCSGRRTPPTQVSSPAGPKPLHPGHRGRTMGRAVSMLHDDNGRIRRVRVGILLGITLPMAIFGPALLAAVPSITDSTLWRGALVFLTVAMFKVPLMILLFGFIRRNQELPGRPTKWSDHELAEILQALRGQAETAEHYPDAEARLGRLSKDAWHVSDQLSGPRQVDALTVALQIDERLIARRRISSSTDTE